MISYIGGKARIGKWIVPFIPKDIETYCEPFSGMFWVFFNMDLKKYPNLKTVVYNDFNGLNANLLNCCNDYDRLWEELNQYPCQQLGIEDTPTEYVEMFNRFQQEVFHSDITITEENKFEVAAKYVYVLTQIFSGSKPETSSYTDYKGKYRCKVLIFMDKLKHPKYREHFDKITFVENLDFQEVIEKYDSDKTYFYVDPPYWKTENYYSNHDFDREDHERLSECLKSMTGMFSLSYYDFPLLNDWFPAADYVWEKKKFAKAAAAKSGVKQNMGEELLIMNYGKNKYINPNEGVQLDLFGEVSLKPDNKIVENEKPIKIKGNINVGLETNHIYCGDTVEEMKKIGDKSIQLILTSPPYLASIRKDNHKYPGAKDQIKDNQSIREYLDWMMEIFKQYERILKDDGVIAFNFSYTTFNPSLPFFLINEVFENTGLEIYDTLTWKKKSCLPLSGHPNRLTRIAELVFIFAKNPDFYANKRVTKISKTGQKYFTTYYNLLEAKNNDGKVDGHEATFSTEFASFFINLYSNINDVILDNFSGTGTTAHAASVLDRQYIGIDLVEKYCDFARKRLKSLNDTRGYLFTNNQ